jgi:hypothetical protein
MTTPFTRVGDNLRCTATAVHSPTSARPAPLEHDYLEAMEVDAPAHKPDS